MRSALVVALVASALLAGCGDSKSVATSVPTATIATVATATTSVPPPPVIAGFRSARVLRVVRSKDHLGGQAEVFFVSGGHDSYFQAKQCVTEYREAGFAAAFCYAFATAADYKHAKVRSNGGMKRLCYTARYGHALSGDQDGDENNDLRDFECR